MNWSKIIASYFVIAQMVLAPISHAATPGLETKDGQLTEEGQKSAAAISEYASKLNYDSKLDLPNSKMLLIDRSTKKVVGEVALRDEKSLMEYSPSRLNKRLAAGLSSFKMASKQSALHAWKSFPIESLAFFLALGAATALQLSNDYAGNPVGMKQHIEHSLSPVGQFGFFIFMYSQGVTSNLLNVWLQRPSLGMPISMVGMTVGMSANSYFTQVMQDVHFRNCAASIFQNKKIEGVKNPCDGVYKYLVVDKKILEGPGIASMLGSLLVVTGARMAIGTVLRIVGVELATLFVPGGIEIKGVRWLLALASSGINAAAFTAVQLKLEHYISYAWKNYFDGKEFNDINDKLVAQIEAQKTSQWTNKTNNLNKDIKDFSVKMSAWRVHNLSEAYRAHQNWSAFLAELTSMYAASYGFYKVYATELTAQDSLIDLTYPLQGVVPKNMADGHEENFLTRPDRIQAMQQETAKDVSKVLGTNLENGYYRNRGYAKFQLDIIKNIQAGLASDDATTQGKAILALNDARRKYAQNVVGAMEFPGDLYRIAAMLGQPNPMFEKGRGYATALMKAPSVLELVKGAPLTNYNGLFKTPTPADYFLVQMMCGPDFTRKEKVISVTKGFPAKFSAPTIALDDEAKETLCFGTATTQLGSERLYNLPVVTQKSAPEFLRANLNPEVAKDFDVWWETNTEKELKAAFNEFGRLYKAIVAKLYTGLNQTKNSSWNTGMVSNGAMIAAFQEARLYSLILGELLKDAYKIQNKAALPAAYFNDAVDRKTTVTAELYKMSKKPLLGLLAYAPRFDFATLTSAQPNADSRSLKVQKQLEGEFAILNGLIQSARTQSVKSADYQAQLTSIEAKISEFSALLGVKKDEAASAFAMPEMPSLDNSTEKPTALVTLNPEQRALAVTCLELLQALSQELTMYGNMAGTARFPDSN